MVEPLPPDASGPPPSSEMRAPAPPPTAVLPAAPPEPARERRALAALAIAAVAAMVWITHPVGIGILLGTINAFTMQPFYEAKGNQPRTIGGKLRMVSVFEPKEESFQPVDGAWDLALWQGRYKRPFIARVRKALSALPAYSRR